MEPCPNCRATVRVGSRFCTSCGFRLPDAESPAASEGTASAVGDGAEPAAGDSPSPWAPADEGRLEGDTSDEAVTAVAGGETEAVGNGDTVGNPDESPPGAVPPSGPTTPAWPGWDDVAPVEEPDTGPGDEREDAEDARSGAVWPGVGGMPIETSPDAYAEDVVVSVGTSGEWPVADPDEPAASWEPPAGADAGPAPRILSPVAPGDGLPVLESDPGGGTVPAPSMFPMRSIHGELTGPSDHPSQGQERDVADPVNQAMLLLEELRRLIGDIQSWNGSAPAGIPAGIVETLLGARAIGHDGGDFSGLATVLSAVRDQPRDIDAMLQLLGRLDDLIALQAAYDRCQEAIESALDQLLPDGAGRRATGNDPVME